MKTTELKRNEHVQILLYGPSGGGKTYTAGLFNEAGPVWFNDTENGIDTLAGWEGIEYEQWYEPVGSPISKIHPGEWARLMKFVDEQIKEPQYKTYVFDSLTTHAEVCAAGVVGRVNPGQTIVQLHHYPSIYSYLTEFMVQIRKIRANVILTAHEDISRDPRGKRVVQPLVIGVKFAPRVPIFWNNVWHIDVRPAEGDAEAPKRRILVNKDDEYTAKTTGRQTDQYIDPTWAAIMDHIGG